MMPEQPKPTEGEALQAEVLAWLKETGRGYKAAERHFGIPRSTVQTWAIAERKGQKPALPDARTERRAREYAERTEEPRDLRPPKKPRESGIRSSSESSAEALRGAGPATEELEDALEADPDEDGWDAANCTRQEFLERAIRRCQRNQRLALRAKHGGVARQWETSMADRRAELDELLSEERAAREAEGRVVEPDPADLARRLVRAMPTLVRLMERAPAIRVYEALGRALGIVDEPEEPGVPGAAQDGGQG